ncbi:MAG: HDOD domain-containing protein, partial [Thermodesulfobacteriota bacterium]
LIKLNKLENTLARAVKYIQTEGKSSTDLRNIPEDIIIQWGRLETLGRLTSGIMHEITTPVQYVTDNMSFLDESFPTIINALDKFSEITNEAKEKGVDKNLISKGESVLNDPDLEYLKNEIPQAVKQSLNGIEKITGILLSVRAISRENLLEKVSSDINKIVENAVLITKSIWQNSADLKTELSSDIPMTVCQPGALNQVLVNLIVNAAHAVEENRSEKDHFIKIETGIKNRFVFIKVSDSGAGIPEKIINKIFNPFFTTKKIEKGTGQGLAIVKTIVEKHGGKISVSSKPQKGTEFTIEIPAKTEEEEKTETKESLLETAPQDEKPLILFVDQNWDMLKSLKRMLKSMEKEWNLAFTQTGENALKIMDKTPADIVVTEYQMKHMSGYNLLKEVKNKFPQTDRIILSGETDEKKIMKTVSIAHQFISKPVNGEKLKKVLKRTIAMRNILKNKHLRKTISRLDSLPSVPSIYREIIEELNSTSSSTKKIGDIISKDPSMTSKTLQVINSGFFYLPSKISKPSEAVVLLGIDIVKALVLNVEIFSKLRLPNFFKKFQSLHYSHSMGTANTAKDIAVSEGLSLFKADQAFMAGLIHDCGKLILASNFPEDYRKVIENTEKNSSSFEVEENSVFGVGHDTAGAFLMGVWGLPLEIIEAILYHHRPSESSDKEFDITAAVHCANIVELAKEDRLNLDFEDAFDLNFIKRLGIEDRIEKWREKFIEG